MQIQKGVVIVKMRDTLIHEYMYSGWEKDKEKNRQYHEFIKYVEKENKAPKETIRVIKGGVVSTLIEEGKYGWINKEWLKDTMGFLLEEYSDDEMKDIARKVNNKIS